MNLTRDEQDMKDEMDYREEVQREVDEGAESKRRASGISIEELSLMDARIEGQRAGHLNLAPGLNPYSPEYPEHQAWEEGRSAVIGAWLNGGLRRIK